MITFCALKNNINKSQSDIDKGLDEDQFNENICYIPCGTINADCRHIIWFEYCIFNKNSNSLNYIITYIIEIYAYKCF